MADKLTEEEVQSLTEKRKARVRPVVQELKKLLLTHEVLLADMHYLEQYVKQELQVMLSGIVFQHVQDIFNMVSGDLEIAVNNAQESLWGKDPEDVSLKDVDKVLKEKKIPKEK